MRYRNFISDVWIQIVNDLVFSIYTAPLYVIVVIFRKKVLMGNKIWKKSRSYE